MSFRWPVVLYFAELAAHQTGFSYFARQKRTQLETLKKAAMISMIVAAVLLRDMQTEIVVLISRLNFLPSTLSTSRGSPGDCFSPRDIKMEQTCQTLLYQSSLAPKLAQAAADEFSIRTPSPAQTSTFFLHLSAWVSNRPPSFHTFHLLTIPQVLRISVRIRPRLRFC